MQPLKVVLSSPIRPWIFLFLLINIGFGMEGGTNAKSRLAALNAVVEEGTFQIDSYLPYTIDWARTPDGHYYSNKAPGPVLFGAPLYFVLDRLITLGADTRAERDARRWKMRGLTLPVLSLVFQVLPFAFLVALCVQTLSRSGVSLVALHLVALFLLFGNTSSFFLNSFLGHGMAAVFVLWLGWLVWCQKDSLWIGLAAGGAALCDYGMLALFPGLAALAWFGAVKDRGRWLRRLLAGLAFPALLWVGYHSVCFGAPWVLPNKFQNPQFVDLAGRADQIWGVFRLLPDVGVLAELLFGFSRGLLWTQPLVLLAFVGLWRVRGTVVGSPGLRGLVILVGVTLPLLLILNAGFGAWHGGSTPGPRYICAVLPLVGWLIGGSFDSLSLRFQRGMWGAMGVGLALYILVYALLVWAPEGSLWSFYLLNPLWRERALVTFGRLIMLSGLFLFAGWKATCNVPYSPRMRGVSTS